jgi:hypothetical protein
VSDSAVFTSPSIISVEDAYKNLDSTDISGYNLSRGSATELHRKSESEEQRAKRRKSYIPYSYEDETHRRDAENTE